VFCIRLQVGTYSKLLCLSRVVEQLWPVWGGSNHTTPCMPLRCPGSSAAVAAAAALAAALLCANCVLCTWHHWFKVTAAVANTPCSTAVMLCTMRVLNVGGVLAPPCLRLVFSAFLNCNCVWLSLYSFSNRRQTDKLVICDRVLCRACSPPHRALCV
jgi:hypothetical protein